MICTGYVLTKLVRIAKKNIKHFKFRQKGFPCSYPDVCLVKYFGCLYEGCFGCLEKDLRKNLNYPNLVGDMWML